MSAHENAYRLRHGGGGWIQRGGDAIEITRRVGRLIQCRALTSAALIRRALALGAAIFLVACNSSSKSAATFPERSAIADNTPKPIIATGIVPKIAFGLPPTIGKPLFTHGGYGTCGAVGFQRAMQTADFPILHPAHTHYTSSSSAPKIASSTVVGTHVIVTAHSSGMAFISIADAAGLRSVCNVGVRLTQGMVR